MKNNKGLIIIVIMLTLTVGILAGVLISKELYFKNDNSTDIKNEINDNINGNKVEKEILEITDKMVVDAISLVRGVVSLPDSAGAYKTIFSGKETVTAKDLKAEDIVTKAIDIYLSDNKSLEVVQCNYDGVDVFTEISKDKLKGYFIEDSSYLNNLEVNKVVNNVKYKFKASNDNVSVCSGIYGFEGPDEVRDRIEVVSAYKEGNKLVVNVKFLYYVHNSKADDPNNNEVFKYNVYSSFDTNSNVIDVVNFYFTGEGYDDSVISLSDYDTYELTFKLDNDKTYFESVIKK